MPGKHNHKKGNPMATVAPVRISAAEEASRSAKDKLERYRKAARKRPTEQWGDAAELSDEAIRVHSAYSAARARANKTE